MIRLLITSGRGPAECRLAIARAVEQIQREAAEAGLELDIVPGRSPDKHGPGSVIVIMSGAGALDFAAHWAGPAQWIAKSPLRPNHRRKNWFVGIIQLDTLAAALTLRREDVRFETLRAGGPGGQHQNTTDSAVRAIHGPSGFMVVARAERSQHRNRALAFQRLQTMLEQQQELDRMQADKDIWAAHEKLQRGGTARKL